MKENTADRYLNEAEGFRNQALVEERLLVILSVLRLVVFAAGLILIWIGFAGSRIEGIIMAAVVTALFLLLLKLYSRHSDKKIFLHNLIRINQDEAAAMSGDHAAFDSGEGYADPHHPFSNDIDLFGTNSLFRYLNRTVTDYGRDVLAGWLLDPFSLSRNLKERQEVVREISVMEKWRHEFMAYGMKKPFGKDDISGLTNWMNESSALPGHTLKIILNYILPAVSVVSFLLVTAGLIHYTVFILIFLTNLLITAAGLKKTNRIHRSVTGIHNYMSALHQLFQVFDRQSFESSVLKEIQHNISGKEVSASVAVMRLSGVIQAFDTRLNILVSFVLNGLLLWDYQCLSRLDTWKSVYRERFPVWMDMLGNIDAYISLGNYAFNNPEFIYPSCSGKGVQLSVISAGHPLIEKGKRVCNDFSIRKSGEVIIITGANMSGKSTFLRTVAVNYILAMAGAPVCAAEMVFTPKKLFTSMRTTDSLSGNESYFYAELRRLKQLKSEIENGEPLLFILDEILKGTNSADKSLGSRLFLTRLIELGGTGLIATHDTSLGEMENEYPGVVVNKCFEIEIDGQIIKFDYKLQNGITSKMNAAILMKQMGILD